jgi:outer membrane immunogenic protein
MSAPSRLPPALPFPSAAADLPIAKASAPVAPVSYAPAAIYSWTGFYIGGQAGAGFGRSSWSDPFTGANNAFNSGPSFLGGGQIGANYQVNVLVLGVEGDFNWTGLRGSGTDSIGNAINTNTNWTSTVTGRVGAAFDRPLIYGKGGVAFARDQRGFTDLAGNGTEQCLYAHRLDRWRRARIRHHQELVG